MNCIPTPSAGIVTQGWRSRRSSPIDIAVLGINLGKTICSLAGLDAASVVIFRKWIKRFRLLDFLGQLPPFIVAMEACGGVHHVGRHCIENGHEPRLISPLYVRPYVKVHKNDDRDAEAIAEASTRPTIARCATKGRSISTHRRGNRLHNPGRFGHGQGE